MGSNGTGDGDSEEASLQPHRNEAAVRLPDWIATARSQERGAPPARRAGPASRRPHRVRRPLSDTKFSCTERRPGKNLPAPVVPVANQALLAGEEIGVGNTSKVWPPVDPRRRITVSSSVAAPSRLLATSARQRICRSRRLRTGSVALRRRSRRTSTTQPVRRRGRSRRGMSACAVAAARTHSRATARATRMRTARCATPARSNGAGRGSGCSLRCARGAVATGSSRRRTTGRARTRAAVAASRSSDSAQTTGLPQAS